MRSLFVLVATVVALAAAAACHKEGQPAPSAAAAAPGATAPAPGVATPPLTAVQPAAPMVADPACTGGACGGSACGGGGGACCDGGGVVAAAVAPTAPVPADAVWTELHVNGMHCGMCAKKIESTLTSVEGVVGVTADFATGVVRVATAPSVRDVRGLVAPRIDALGYHVAL